MSPAVDLAPMPAVPVPSNEVERIKALDRLEILDTMPEEAIDRITRLTSRIVGTPISLVSLVDANRQWFKSRVGLDATETPREYAFCAHAIMDDEVLVVEDATRDRRFARNPLVTGAPDIRSYAGAPLIAGEGVRLGTLCAIDTKPRTFSDDELAVLRDLASVVVDEFTLRMALRTEEAIAAELREERRKLEHANQSLDQFAYMASHDLRAPLKKIINLLDLAGLDHAGEPSPLTELARASAVNLEMMVSGYRELSQLRFGGGEHISVAALVDRALDLTDDIPVVDVRADIELFCDPMLMTQVFSNLVANARIHGAGGPVAITATTGVAETTIRVINDVAEDCSVDKSIFAPFRRGGTETDGTGLGLAIVQRIVQIHGGAVVAACTGGVFAIEIQLPTGGLSS